MKLFFKIIVLMFICMLCSEHAYAQNWAKTYGTSDWEVGSAISATADGGFYVAGTAEFDNNGYDIVVLRLDALGNVIWQKYYGGKDYDHASSIIALPDGGCLVAGSYDNYSSYYDDMWVLRLDSMGNIRWQRKYGGSSEDSVTSIAISTDGNFLVGGNTRSFGGGYDQNILLLKLDQTGNVIWQKVYGGKNYDYLGSIISTPDGGFIIAASSESFSNGWNSNIWIVKSDSNGNIQWQETLGGSNSDYGYDVKATPDGGYILTGVTYSWSSEWKPRLWIIKFNSIGVIEWQKLYKAGDYLPNAFIYPSGDGGYIILTNLGYYPEDILIVKLDHSGAIQWAKTYGSIYDDSAAALTGTSDGGFAVAGTTYSYGAGASDMWILKLDQQGDIGNDCSLTKPYRLPKESVTDKPTRTNAWIGNISVTMTSTSEKPVDSQCVSTMECGSGASFWITCNPSSLPYLLRISTCSVNSFLDFSSIVYMSCSDLPEGASCLFSPDSISPMPGTSVTTLLSVKLNSKIPKGTYPFKVIGTNGNTIRTYLMQFKVN